MILTGKKPSELNSVDADKDDIFIAEVDGIVGKTNPVGNNKSFYDSGEGFWVYATPGVVTTIKEKGFYSMSIPADCDFQSFSRLFVDANLANDLSGTGFIFNINWNRANTSWADAMILTYNIIINGQQYDFQATGQVSPAGSLQTMTPSEGGYMSIFTNINNIGSDFVIKGKL